MGSISAASPLVSVAKKPLGSLSLYLAFYQSRQVLKSAILRIMAGNSWFKDWFNPTELELRAWATDSESAEPTQDWDLILSWEMDRGRLRILIDLANTPQLPHRSYVLMVLYQWVAYIARKNDFDLWKGHYDEWLEEARGIRDPDVKNWRHQAKIIFQGNAQFDFDAWWSGCPGIHKDERSE